jgi:phenylacetate-CoA ligase
MLIIRGVNVFPSQIETVIMNIGTGVEPHYQLIVDRVEGQDTLEVQVEMSQSLFSDEVKSIENVRYNLEKDLQSMLSVHAKVKLCDPMSCPAARERQRG